MAIEFQSVRVSNNGTKSVDFTSTVKNAVASVQGFEMRYTNSDNHVREIQVLAAISSINGKRVTVTGEAAMFDDSENQASGTVEILVIAETV